MICLLCSLSETQFDLNRGKRIGVKHPQDVTGVICFYCFQMLLSATQEKIRGAYKKALDAGLLDKAGVLGTCLEEEKQDGRKTKKSKRNLIRESPLRMVKPTLDKIGAQQAVI